MYFLLNTNSYVVLQILLENYTIDVKNNSILYTMEGMQAYYHAKYICCVNLVILMQLTEHKLVFQR